VTTTHAADAVLEITSLPITALLPGVRIDACA